MRHVSLTCINHPDLRWTCKAIAVSPYGNTEGAYNGVRHIFFNSRAIECACPAKDLRIAPEDPFHSITPEGIREAIRQ
jgi:hypothetical protein